MRVGVIIGRFQPLHNGHIYLINQALDNNDAVEILIASHPERRTKWNPFFHRERVQMIKECFPEYMRLSIGRVDDVSGDDAEWSDYAKDIASMGHELSADFRLYCHEKDALWFAKHFSADQWDVLPYGGHESDLVNSTFIRRAYFELGYEPHEIPGIPYMSMHYLNKLKGISLAEGDHVYAL